jgi:hypothetical protein
MSRRARLRVAAFGAVLLSLAWAGVARATPDFPAVVVKTFDLPAIQIDPPQGCELCHTSDSGGTSLRPFGALLLQYGVQPYEETTLEQALGEVEQNEPQLVADIKAGRDPNDDTGSADVHTPEYGCAAAGAPAHGRLAWLAALAPLALTLRRRRARRRRPLRPSASARR